jgi:deoxyribose-phosphate aldolase
MTESDKHELARRLSREFGGNGHPRPDGADPELQRALERMVGVGACRFGIRASEGPAGGPPSDACALAPPIARLIDHTVLTPDTTEERIVELCAEARENCFASVCVNPCWVPLAAAELRGSSSVVCTVIGFPFGANRAPVKAFEAEQAVHDGALEIDMVLNIGFLKSGRYAEVEDDIRGVVEATRNASGGKGIVKVILETALLTDEEKVIACVLSQNAGADFVKTSTGFAKGGASPQDIALMRRVAGEKMGVKASGGIRSLETAEQMVASGATRIGASASVAIVQGAEASAGSY